MCFVSQLQFETVVQLAFLIVRQEVKIRDRPIWLFWGPIVDISNNFKSCFLIFISNNFKSCFQILF